MSKYTFSNITEDNFSLIKKAFTEGNSICLCVGEGNKLGIEHYRKLSKIGRDYEDLIVAEVHIASFGTNSGIDYGYLIINSKQEPKLNRIISDFVRECGIENAWISKEELDKNANKQMRYVNLNNQELVSRNKPAFLIIENNDLYLITRNPVIKID